ncbi:MAG: hypothetical protein WCH39_18585 [Schlesneria sp.]
MLSERLEGAHEVCNDEVDAAPKKPTFSFEARSVGYSRWKTNELPRLSVPVTSSCFPFVVGVKIVEIQKGILA